MSELLRQYEPHECVHDGYPWPWAHSILIPDPTGEHSLTDSLPIKDLIREEAGHRCLRCGHPYRVGEVGERGEWSPCDTKCLHLGDVRMKRLDREEEWAETQLRYPAGGCLYKREEFIAIEARWRILTVHHLDEDKGNCRWWNLAALCQRCHLRMQRAVVMDRPWHYEHSEWFKLFAAAFYAFKYLGEDLTREETMARLDELLALEHRWTQEALL